MKIKANYVIIPAVTFLVAGLGGYFTQAEMLWYETTLVKPGFTPPGWVFSVAWNIIFLCATASALIVWNKKHDKVLMSIFAANAVLNVLWSFLFFQMHWIEASFIEMFLLETTLIAMIMVSWEISKTASLLLLPYAGWVAFATYLTYVVLELNP